MSTLWRSAGVGLAATVADLLALVLLVQVAGLAPVAANVPALLVGLAVQFAGNKLLAFRDRSPDWARQAALFGLIEIGGLALNGLGFHLLVVATPLPYAVARVVSSSLVYFGYSYPLWTKLFRRLA